MERLFLRLGDCCDRDNYRGGRSRSNQLGTAVKEIIPAPRRPERASARGLNVVTMLVAATTVAFLTQVDGPASAFTFAILFGANARGAVVLGQVLIA